MATWEAAKRLLGQLAEPCGAPAASSTEAFRARDVGLRGANPDSPMTRSLTRGRS